MINFRPIGKWLSVSFQPPTTRSKGGLYLATPIYSQIATVIATGDGVEHIKAGDLVFMHKYGDAMETQKGLWYHYFEALRAGKSVDDFKSAPVVVTEDDVFALWDEKLGVIPHRNNLVLIEHEIPERVNGIIRILRHRQNRKPIADVLKVSAKVVHFKAGQQVLLGKYGGVYFTDIDGKEKVLASASEVLATFTGEGTINNITVGEPKEVHDPKAFPEFQV